MKQTFTMHLYWNKYSGFQLFATDTLKGDGYNCYIHPVEVEVEVPDDFDPKAAEVAALRAEEVKLRAAYQARVTEIHRRINSLLAIENCVEAA